MPDDEKDTPNSQFRAVPLEDVRRARGETRVALPRSKVASLRAFRRVRSDRAWGAVGILLLLIGVALIFSWEKPPVVEKKFGVEWPQTTFEEPPVVGANQAEGSAVTGSYKMVVPNATALIFTLLWEDDVGNDAIEGDRLRIQVFPPSGLALTNVTLDLQDQARSGNLSIRIPLNGIPDIASVPADTNESAMAAVGDRTNRTGLGDWTYEVRVIAAPGDYKDNNVRDPASCRPGTPETPLCKPDGFENYELRISYVTYSLRLKKLF